MTVQPDFALCISYCLDSEHEYVHVCHLRHIHAEMKKNIFCIVHYSALMTSMHNQALKFTYTLLIAQ